MISIYHCRHARSLRPLWTLEEMGIAYTVHALPFPPRVHARSFLAVNPLGTIPYLVDGDVRMSESVAMTLYLAERHGPTPLLVGPDEPDRPAFLNWLFFADATLTFPQTLVLRYARFEAEERRNPGVAEDYAKWFAARLRAVEDALADRTWLCAGRFTLADICIGYALHLADDYVGLGDRLGPNVRGYLDRARARPSFARLMAIEARTPD